MRKTGARLLSLIAACVVFAAGAEAQKKDSVFIAYGGLSYQDATTTPYMAKFLSPEATGSALDEANRLHAAAERKREQINAAKAFKAISPHGLVGENEEAWALVSAGGPRPAGSLDEILGARFEKVYGVILVASVEYHFYVPGSYTDPDTGERIEARKSIYVAGVDAMLIELGDNGRGRILLSASGLEDNERRSRRPEDDTPEIREADMRATYQEAIEEAMDNLARVARKGIAKDRDLAMVTGFSIRDKAAADIFHYDRSKRSTPQSLQAGMCSVPSGCAPDDAVCQRAGVILQQGLTTAMSKAGRSVLPPLFSAYAGDTNGLIELNLSLSRGKASVLGTKRTLTLDPADAPIKLVPELVGVAMLADQDSKALPGIVRDRQYAAVGTWFTARTDAKSCMPGAPVAEQKDTSKRTIGCITETYIKRLGPPDEASHPGLYALAMLDYFENVATELNGGRADFQCKQAGKDDDR